MSKATLLIAENDDMHALLLKNILSRQDYATAGLLTSGEEAITFLADKQIDLILMDFELAGAMSGIHSAQTIHETSDTPVIFLIELSHHPRIEEAETAAPYDFLIKPVGEDQLITTLKIALHRHALERNLRERQITLEKNYALQELSENSAYKHFIGKTSEQILGADTFALHPPALAQFYHDKDDELFLTGTPQAYETKIRNSRGELRDGIVHKALMTDSNNITTGLVGAILDITERILFIDDEEILVNMTRTILERLGYHVTVQNSSLAALTLFTKQPDAFDLVITDQTMPGMTGIDLARRMLQIRPNLPIILSTGYSSLIAEDKVKAVGIKGIALKPMARKDIAKLIRKVLGKRD